ncbi:MAG: segregation/condensation protein A [bacterium]|nr:segregation/condensation protein A [bacterium]
MAASYQVKLEVFEGPFDLLLHLIRKNEMDICAVSLSEITGQYLAYIQMMHSLDLDIAGEFLVIAATLIYIKSQKLLPQPELPPEVEEFDPEAMLLARLAEYKKYKELAMELDRKRLARELIFMRDNHRLYEAQDEEYTITATVNDLFLTYKQLSRFMEPPAVCEIDPEDYTIEAKIDYLNKLLKTRSRWKFSELVGSIASRLELAVTVLAMLELCRLKHVQLRQPQLFGEIYISKYTKRKFHGLNQVNEANKMNELEEVTSP